MCKKKFEYLGFTFTPLRNFTKTEAELGINLPLVSIGISNYDKERMPMHTSRTDKWNWNDFYEAAKYNKYDIFLINGIAEVIPGSNELFAYTKEQADKFNANFPITNTKQEIDKPDYVTRLSELGEEALQFIQQTISKHKHIILFDFDEEDSNDTDIIDMPDYFVSANNEYANIDRIKILPDGIITVYSVGKISGEDYMDNLIDLHPQDLCYLADHISNPDNFKISIEAS